MNCLLPLVTGLLVAHQQPDVPDWGRRIQWSREAGPPAREHATFVPHAEHNRAIMLAGSGYEPYGAPLGDAWAFDFVDESWRKLELVGDELRAGGSRRAAPVAGGAFVHGGYGAGFAQDGDLWRLEFEQDRVRIERMAQDNPPPARLLHAFACDPAGQRFVVFGGLGDDDAFDDTWLGTRTANGVRWRRLQTKIGPGKRFGFSFAHDAELDRLLVCGGQVPPEGDQTGMVVVSDLWSLDFAAETPAWTKLAEYDADDLRGRRNPAFTFDSGTGDLFVWGGTADGATALPDLHVVRTRIDGAPVERIEQPVSIPTRASGFGIVDAERARALLGFGNTAAGPFYDLVEIRLRPRD